MIKLVQRTCVVISALTVMALMLTGCGGGSGGVSSQVVSGIASAGSPLAGQVTLKDSSNPPQQKTTVIGSDGSFAFDVTGLKAPFILQGTGNSNGSDYKLYSFADGTGIANVNPLSNALVAGAAEVADPEQVYAAPDAATLQKIKTNLPAATSDLLSQLQPLLQLYSADGKDPIKDQFNANHQGMDGLFDNVKITIPSGIITIANAQTGAVIFTASVANIKNGTFAADPNSLPQPPAVPVDPNAVTVAGSAVPTGVIATGGTKQVSISWNAVSTATSYNVYYSTTPGVTKDTGTKIANATSPTVQIGLAAGTTYYYIITAVNSAGEGPASVQVAATTLNTAQSATVPAVPSNVSAAGSANQVTISWLAASGANSYNIYWSTAPGVTPASGTRITGVTSPYIQTGLAAATSYYYIITALNSAGESAPSAQTSATTSAPPASKQLTLTWDPVAGATSYNLYWSTVPGVTPASGNKLSVAANSYVHTGLAPGTTYYYVVTAADSTSESAPSNQVSKTTAL